MSENTSSPSIKCSATASSKANAGASTNATRRNISRLKNNIRNGVDFVIDNPLSITPNGSIICNITGAVVGSQVPSPLALGDPEPLPEYGVSLFDNVNQPLVQDLPLLTGGNVSSIISSNSILSNTASLVSMATAIANASSSENSNNSSLPDAMIVDMPTSKLRRHHKFNRVIVFSNMDTNTILSSINMNMDTVYGTKELTELGCTILFFKTSKLATTALANAANAKIVMFSQTCKTEHKYAIGIDLCKENATKLLSKVGDHVVSMNISNRKGNMFWAVGTNNELPNRCTKMFKLKKVDTSLTVFRVAFPFTNKKHLKKLVSAASTQWKVKIEEAKLENKIAYLSVNKKQITNNITEFVKVKHQSFKNLSFSAKVAMSIAQRLNTVETSVKDLTTVITKVNKRIANLKTKNIESSILKLTERIDMMETIFNSFENKLNALLKSTAHESPKKGNGGKRKGRQSSKF